MSKPNWIDFKALKEALDFNLVLSHLGIELKGSGEQWSGFCPLPTHKHKGGSKAKSPSFSANSTLKAFQCFGCGAKGNVLDLACLMQGRDPEDTAAFRETSITLAKTFGIAMQAKPDKSAVSASEAKPKPVPSEPPKPAKPSMPEIINPPLGFELKELDFTHPYLLDRGFNEATIEHFGLGFCKKGLMKDRIAIPIQNCSGELVAYAGRITDDARIGAQCPRYLFPSDREKDGVRFVFRKSALLYNAHRVKALGRRGVIVVESYSAVWWLHQVGFPNVVAVMGSSMAESQAELLRKEINPSFVVILADGDEAGARMAASALSLLAPHAWARTLLLESGEQPTNVSAALLQERLGKLMGK